MQNSVNHQIFLVKISGIFRIFFVRFYISTILLRLVFFCRNFETGNDSPPMVVLDRFIDSSKILYICKITKIRETCFQE